jgi:myo-inositol-1(or 4)-monophosphatase
MTVRLPDRAALGTLPAELAGFPAFVEELVGLFGARGVGRPHVPRRASDDGEIERDLVGRIQRLFPGAGILAEEHFHAHGREIDGPGPVRAVLDPIDGTNSYLRGEPSFTGSAAFELGGRTLAGVVHHPLSDTTWVAIAGAGAFVNGRRLPAPADVPRVVAVGANLMGDRTVSALCRLLDERGYRVHALGSVALRLCQTATGERAGTVKRLGRTGPVLRSWGVAAGLLMCEEAGVRVRRLPGMVVAAGAEVQALLASALGGAP